MGSTLILETTFLIDLEREHGRTRPGPAHSLLEHSPDSHLYITPTIAGELAAGTSLEQRPRWEEFVAPFQMLAHTPDVCWEYGRAYRYLSDNGILIGSNDLWIAASGLAYGMPVVTRNERHFKRVPGLAVRSYR